MRLLGAACLCLGLCLAPADAERDVFFFEDFEGDTTGWVKSEATKLTEAREVLKFSGEWAVERPSPLKGEPVSKGLVVKTPSALHAISYKFPSPFVFDEGREFVLQYEVKLQRSISCGGAYLKLLSAGDWSPGQFDDRTPYSLMFGPDKCEPSDRVHFIIRHENPRTGAVEEKHMKDPPKTAAGRMTSLYTLVVFPNSTFQILINQEEVRRGTLMEDFDPPFAPPREIDDPSDRKPFDWDDEERIPDPSAKKPEDWDEDEPMMIEDPASVKPEDWLDDEPELIPSPGAQRPAEWNEDEDGPWAPPMIDNPRCLEVSGCGVWRPPYKRNPRYKGRWRAPLIDNPAYRGQWRPRQMPNPDYFEVKHPNKFIPVDGIGFEIWTLHDGIHFDNILLADSLRAAGAVAERTWRVKRDNEKAALAELAKNDNLDQPRKILREYFETIKEQSVVYLSSLAQDPIQTVIEFPTLTAVFLLFPTLAFLILLLAFSPGGSKPFPRRELPEVEPDEGKKAAGQGSSPSPDKD